ncbi:MAG: hypothetical protein HZR80_13385 [Candidatus Heimdallarchaeota archaeon]
MELNQTATSQLVDEVWSLFFAYLQNDKKIVQSKTKSIEQLTTANDIKVSEFILELIKDFTASFYEELIDGKNQQMVLKSLNLLINQQILISWINLMVEQSINPLLIFSVKSYSKIEEIKEVIIRILLTSMQDRITSEEAENQISAVLTISYNISEELTHFVKSLVKTVIKYKEKHGLEELAKIGEESLKSTNDIRARTHHTIPKTMKDPLYDHGKIANEWMQNILLPSCIGLRIAKKELYTQFIDKCKKNFELFLDQALTAEDFEKRLNEEFKKFGGEEEELIMPIRESIASSVRFLEVARIDDPSLSMLLFIIDEERENARRTCT